MSRKRKSCDFDAMKITPARKSTYKWTDRDLLNLTAALQCYGFSETKKIAEVVGTKDETEVKFYLENEIRKLNRKSYGERSMSFISKNHTWFHPHANELKSWPSVRKWRRLMYNQLIAEVKTRDYSKVVMEDLLQAFYEEAEETSDPQVINVKAVYKYLLDCVRGYVPAELPPIDSGVVLLLLGQLKEMQRDLDFDEEINFIKTFKKAKQFKPLKIKDEFKGNRKKSEMKQNAPDSSEPENNTESEMELIVPESSERKNNTESEMELIVPESSERKNNKESEMEQNTPESSDRKNILESKIEQNVPGSSEPKNDLGAGEDKDDDDDEEAIDVTEEMYLYLTKHKKLVQSMNPLNIPLWTLIKEQGYVQNKCELSPRMNCFSKPGVKSQIE